jgi:hypothetical protein
MHRFLPALVQMQGGACVSVPVAHRPRVAGQSHYGVNNRLWVGLVDLAGVMWLRRRSRLPAPLEEAAFAAKGQPPRAAGERSEWAGRSQGGVVGGRNDDDLPKDALLQGNVLHGREA